MVVEIPKKHECPPLASKVQAAQVGLRATEDCCAKPAVDLK